MRLTGILVLVLAVFNPECIEAQQITHTFMHDGVMRNYDVHLPQAYEAGMPLVFMLHGYSEDKDWFRDYTLFHEYADTAGFVLAVPLGYPGANGRNSWNIGIETCPMRGVMPTVNDVGFVSAMIDSIYENYAIDLERVYACGYSTGGEMCFWLAAELGHRFAAIASIAGTMYDPDTSWQTVAPIPILKINGTRDNYVFYHHPDSTINEHHPGEWSIPRTLQYWIENNGCAATGDTVDLPDLDTTDNCRVQKMTWTGDSLNADVVHYKIIDGGHHWPQGQLNWSKGGNINKDIDGNETIWKFLQKYTNPHVNVAWAPDYELSPSFIDPDGGTLELMGNIRNPSSHEEFTYGVVEGLSSGFRDTLSDHSLAREGRFHIESSLTDYPEEYFQVMVYTTDLNDSLTIKSPHLETFTTVGPLRISNVTTTGNKAFTPGAIFNTFISLANHGASVPVENVYVTLSSSAPEWVYIMGSTSRSYGNIAAGDTVTNSLYYWVKIAADCPTDTSIMVTLDISSDGHVYWQDDFLIRIDPPVSTDGAVITLPERYDLKQNYPNPFNPRTTIKYEIPEQSDVSLIIYDISGRAVQTLTNRPHTAGSYEVSWDGTNHEGQQVSAGMYFARMQAGDYSSVLKMAYLR